MNKNITRFNTLAELKAALERDKVEHPERVLEAAGYSESGKIETEKGKEDERPRTD